MNFQIIIIPFGNLAYFFIYTLEKANEIPEMGGNEDIEYFLLRPEDFNQVTALVDDDFLTREPLVSPKKNLEPSS